MRRGASVRVQLFAGDTLVEEATLVYSTPMFRRALLRAVARACGDALRVEMLELDPDPGEPGGTPATDGATTRDTVAPAGSGGAPPPPYRAQVRLARFGRLWFERTVVVRGDVPPLALARAFRQVAPRGTHVAVAEVDPLTGDPRPLTAIDRALDALLGDLT